MITDEEGKESFGPPIIDESCLDNYASNTSEIMKANCSRDLSYDHLITYSNNSNGSFRFLIFHRQKRTVGSGQISKEK